MLTTCALLCVHLRLIELALASEAMREHIGNRIESGGATKAGHKVPGHEEQAVVPALPDAAGDAAAQHGEAGAAAGGAADVEAAASKPALLSPESPEAWVLWLNSHRCALAGAGSCVHPALMSDALVAHRNHTSGVGTHIKAFNACHLQCIAELA